MESKSVIRRMFDVAVICLRIFLTLFLIWKAYGETGIWTAISLFLIFLFIGLHDIVNSYKVGLFVDLISREPPFVKKEYDNKTDTPEKM